MSEVGDIAFEILQLSAPETLLKLASPDDFWIPFCYRRGNRSRLKRVTCSCPYLLHNTVTVSVGSCLYSLR